MHNEWANLVRRRLEEHAAVQARLLASAPVIAAAGRMLADILAAGGQVLFCGNGGSASDALHLAGELSGRFYLSDREPLPAIALNGNPAALTAIANDYGYEEVFARQVLGLGREGDALVALSTSGTSPNVVAALRAARDRKMFRVSLTGETGGEAAPLSDYCIKVASSDTPRVQEMHILAGHLLCEIVESALFGQR